MVKVAVAGANSGLAREVINKLVEDGAHQVVALSRKDPSEYPEQLGVTWVKTAYDEAELVELFRGVEVVLNFIVVNNDVGNVVSTRLVDAAVKAGVKRFAPSEWAMSQKIYDVVDVASWYQGKIDMQTYLRKINKDKKVIEYCFFQPGIFLEYIAYPRDIFPYISSQPTLWQIDDDRITLARGHEDTKITFTSVHDIAGVTRRAIEYPGTWPEIGGMQGTHISAREIQQLVKRVLGRDAKLDFIEPEDIAAGRLPHPLPFFRHPSIPADMVEAIQPAIWGAIVGGAARGAWSVTDEWNKLLPDYKFMTAEEYIRKTWKN